jgi:hypothetical protein
MGVAHTMGPYIQSDDTPSEIISTYCTLIKKA